MLVEDERLLSSLSDRDKLGVMVLWCEREMDSTGVWLPNVLLLERVEENVLDWVVVVESVLLVDMV